MNTINPLLIGGIAAVVATSLSAVSAVSADENPFHAQAVERSGVSEQRLAMGNCGGSWEGRCGGMMDGMMMGGAMPPALDPKQLPEPDSAGARLLMKYCTQCHSLPSPTQHSAVGWPATVARMNTRMQWMVQNRSPTNIVQPSDEELNTLTSYLEKHAVSDSSNTPESG